MNHIAKSPNRNIRKPHVTRSGFRDRGHPPFQACLACGLEDQSVTVPLPEAPLGSTSISLTQSLVGIPQSIASIDLVLEASVRMVRVSSTSSSVDMLTDINGLVWTSWGAKSISLLTSEKVDATVRATLEYAPGTR